MLLILLATTFHYSSFVFIFLYFLSPDRFNKFFYLLLIPISYLTYLLLYYVDIISILINILPLPDIINKLVTYSADSREEQAINVLGIYPITRLAIYIFFTFWAARIFSFNKYSYLLVKIYGFGVFAYIALAMYPYISVRIGYTLMLAEIMLIPCLIYIVKGYYVPRMLVILFAFLAFTLNLYYTSYFNYIP